MNRPLLSLLILLTACRQGYGQGFQWHDVERWPSSGNYFAASGISNGKITYQCVNYGTYWSRWTPGSYSARVRIVCRDSSGNMLSVLSALPVSGDIYFQPHVVDRTGALFGICSSNIIGSSGIYSSTSVYLTRVTSGGAALAAYLGNSTHGNTSGTERELYVSPVSTDHNGNGYLTVEAEAVNILGTPDYLLSHTMDLRKYDASLNLVWKRKFGDVKTIYRGPSNRYSVIATDGQKIYVAAYLQNDSFLCGGIKYKAAAGYNILQFDTAGNYLSWASTVGFAKGPAKFDAAGNLVTAQIYSPGTTVQLDSSLSITVPSGSVYGHTIVSAINPNTGKNAWYTTFYTNSNRVTITSIVPGDSGKVLLFGYTSGNMIVNGDTLPFATEIFWGKVDTMGDFHLFGRTPTPNEGAITAVTGWESKTGNWVISTCAEKQDVTLGCDKITKESLVISRWVTDSLTYPKPTVSSSGNVFSKIGPNTVTLRWKKGNGRARIVVASKSSAVTSFPANSVEYTANSVFGLGHNLGSSNFVVYSGTDSTVNVSGLDPRSQYYFKIFEYNGCNMLTTYELTGDTSSFTTFAKYYYTKDTGAINALSTWGDQPDGSGTPPPSFDVDSVYYYVVNNLAPYISTTYLNFPSTTSLLLIGDSVHNIKLEVADSSILSAYNLRITPNAALLIKGSCYSNSLIGDSLSVLELDDTRYLNIVANVHDLRIHTTAPRRSVGGNITVKNKLTLDGQMELSMLNVGTDPLHPGTIDYISGSVAVVHFTRYIKSAVTAGNEGFFPIGLRYKNTILNRLASINYTTAPSPGGLVKMLVDTFRTMNYNGLPLTDYSGGDTAIMVGLFKTTWVVDPGLLRGGVFEIQVQDSNPGNDSISNLRLLRSINTTTATSSLAGTYSANSGTPLFPVVKASGCSPLIPALNNRFFVGEDDTSLYQLIFTKPTVQASNFWVAAVESNRMLLRWTRGNGLYCMVIARKTTAVNAWPVDGVTYPAHSIFNNGSQIGSGNYVVYSGTADSVWVNNLSGNSWYHYVVLEFNGYPGGQKYLTNPVITASDLTRAVSAYYNKAGQPLNQLGTWGMNSDGSGDTLQSFNKLGVRYYLQNGDSAILTDTLMINPAGSPSWFYVGNGALQPFTLRVASGARMILGNTTVYPGRVAKIIINGGFSCEKIERLSLLYESEIELNTPDMVNPISPVSSTGKWSIPKLKIKGGYYYELPYIEVIDSFELDAMVSGILAMNNTLSGSTVVNYVSGGSTVFGHALVNGGVSYSFPTIMVENTGAGYKFHNRPAQVKCTYIAPTSYCSDPFFVRCISDQYLPSAVSGFPLVDSSTTSLETMNAIYNTNTKWVGSFGWDGSSTCTGNYKLEVLITDTILPGLIDTHALAVWSHLYHPSAYPIDLRGKRTPCSISGNLITAGRTDINYNVASSYFGAITFGLAVDSNKQLLPVTWLSFQAKAIGKNVSLQWSTASEENNSHFEIERSADGKNFVFAGRVEGNGTTSNIHAYQFTDAGAFEKGNSSVLYYRLKQMDFNGDFAYSEIRVVHQNEEGVKQPAMAYPNPFRDELFVLLNNVEVGCEIRLMDVTGKVWHHQSGKSGLQSIQVNELPAGVYFLQVVNNGETTTQKIIKAY